MKLFAPIGASVRTKGGRAPTCSFWTAPDQPLPQGNLSSARTGNGTLRRRMSDQDEAVAITIVGETQAPDLLVEGNAELFVRNTGGSEEAPPPALPAGPRPVDENAALPADYPARGGVPQCLAAQHSIRFDLRATP